MTFAHPDECCDEMLEAASTGNIKLLDELINSGIDVDANDCFNTTPLMLAVLNHHYETTEYLLNKGADVNRWELRAGFSPVHIAVQENLFNFLNLFIKYGADLDNWGRFGRTPLIMSIHDNNITMLDFLLSHGADPNTSQEAYGTRAVEAPSPILYAIKNINLDAVKLLIKYGVKVNFEFPFKIQPLIEAVKIKSIDIVTELIKNSANINVYDWYGDTPLIVSKSLNWNEGKDYLLKHGADENFIPNVYEDISDEVYAKVENIILTWKKKKYNANLYKKYINAILWRVYNRGAILVVGNKYGSWSNAKNFFVIWIQGGVWEKIIEIIKNEPGYEFLKNIRFPTEKKDCGFYFRELEIGDEKWFV